MISLTVDDVAATIVKSMAPMADRLFATVRMTAEDFKSMKLSALQVRIIAEVIAAGGGYVPRGCPIRLVSAGREKRWDYRLYAKVKSRWMICRLEAECDLIPKRHRDYHRKLGWNAVFGFFLG